MIREASPRLQMHIAYLKTIIERQTRDKSGNLPDDEDRIIAGGIILALNEAYERGGKCLDEKLAIAVCKRFYSDKYKCPPGD